ncbi:hypothetical protein C7I87_35010 [Mesorhizobium sp. SARCC-RB16n]|uniref:hypothetical protein n=1 Tax=Mesorhizobium sp. SARCC-RB16n TaxID=2116687 RepID=UPI00122F78C4|nr:hypothetical protein [Mesorhizobium sp. SARCC-RB16n]KAA3441557.1 hypothetical protein C7I87_35010 [Mesorhizobium sp. SARCC-RB16n]
MAARKFDPAAVIGGGKPKIWIALPADSVGELLPTVVLRPSDPVLRPLWEKVLLIFISDAATADSVTEVRVDSSASPPARPPFSKMNSTSASSSTIRILSAPLTCTSWPFGFRGDE